MWLCTDRKQNAFLVTSFEFLRVFTGAFAEPVFASMRAKVLSSYLRACVHFQVLLFIYAARALLVPSGSIVPSELICSAIDAPFFGCLLQRNVENTCIIYMLTMFAEPVFAFMRATS